MDRTAQGLLRRSLDVATELGERTRAGAGQLADRAAAAGLPAPEDVLRVVRSSGLAGEDDVDQLRAEVEGLRHTARTLSDRLAELEAHGDAR